MSFNYSKLLNKLSENIVGKELGQWDNGTMGQWDNGTMEVRSYN